MINLKKISTYIWQYKWKYLLAVTLLFLAVTLDMFAPRLNKMIVDDVMIGGKIKLLAWILPGFFIIGLSRCICQYFKETIFDNAELSKRLNQLINIQLLPQTEQPVEAEAAN